MSLYDTLRGAVPIRRTIRVAVTGLAESGKTTVLTSLAANLLAYGRTDHDTLPALSRRLARRSFRVTLAPASAHPPPFNYAGKLASLAADPPDWPEKTALVSILALDIDIGRGWPASALPLPDQQIRLELLDYPGEWLIDIPMLAMPFERWSEATLARIGALAPDLSREFRAFVAALPLRAAADDALVSAGVRLFQDVLHRLKQRGYAMLQPGRLVMRQTPDPAPAWMRFFPVTGDSPLARAMAGRFAAYGQLVSRELASPAFAGIDHMIVLADVLTALHDGRDALNDAMEALRAVGNAVSARQGGFFTELLGSVLPIAFGIERVAIAATKADHVAERQRGNLRALVRDLAGPGLAGSAEIAPFAIASVRCTEDTVMTLDGRPVSAVRGRLIGRESFAKSYPGEVPDRVPGAEFWQHGFYELPQFEPVRPHLGGAGGIAHIDLDRVIAFILSGILPDE